MAFLNRCTQSFFHRHRQNKHTEENFCCEIYADDPAMAARGSKASRGWIFVVVILVWWALGFRLSFSSAQRCFRGLWIRSLIWLVPGCMIAAIQEKRVEE